MTGLIGYLQWYDMIYLLPGGIAMLLLLLSALGSGMHQGNHCGMGHGHLSSQTHSGHGHPGQGHQGAGHRSHGPQAASTIRTQQLSSFFGLGRVPAPLVYGSALLGWGLFGFWGTQFWQGILHLPIAFVLPSLVTALAGAFVTEKVTVETAFRFLPGDESYAVSAVELCGLTGTVAFPIDATRGRVHVYDTHGTLHDLSARAAPTQGVIPRGHTVLVADYDNARDQLIVEEAL